MNTHKILLAFILATAVLVAQIGTVFAAQTVQKKSQVTIASPLMDEEPAQHPVGAALAAYFADITDYETIMKAYEGEFDFGACGFGVISQALWLTRKMGGDSDTFLAILLAKQTGDYSAFTFAEGTTVPENWGQFRKLVLDGEKKGNLGVTMSHKDEDHGNNGNNDNNGQGNNTHENNGKNDEKDNNRQNQDRGNGKNK